MTESEEKIIGTHDPINTKELQTIIDAGIAVDMYLQYENTQDTDKYGHFLLFVRYNKTIIRQVYTFVNKPRQFKDIARALAFGKEYGLRTVSLEMHFEEYETKILDK